MKVRFLAAVFVVAWVLGAPAVPVALAKASSGGHGGGGHGGGHGSGGHSGGQASGGHATGRAASGQGSGHKGGQAAGGGNRSGHATGTASPRASGASTSSSGTSSHSRDSHPVVGTAVPRTSVPPVATSPVIVRSYRASPFGYGYYGGTLGLGFYDPFYPAFGFPGYMHGYSYAPYPFDEEGVAGGLRLKVEPKDAAVSVDGFYAGIVDDFNGHFQHLDLTPGPHHVRISRPGYEPLDFDVAIQPHHTTVYRGTLPRSAP